MLGHLWRMRLADSENGPKTCRVPWASFFCQNNKSDLRHLISFRRQLWRYNKESIRRKITQKMCPNQVSELFFSWLILPMASLFFGRSTIYWSVVFSGLGGYSFGYMAGRCSWARWLASHMSPFFLYQRIYLEVHYQKSPFIKRSCELEHYRQGARRSQVPRFFWLHSCSGLGIGFIEIGCLLNMPETVRWHSEIARLGNAMSRHSA